MQTLTGLDMVAIEDYHYITTFKNENMNWMKPTHLLPVFPLNLRAPFCTSTYTHSILMSTHFFLFLFKSSLICIMYANLSNNTPSYTHVSSYVL